MRNVSRLLAGVMICWLGAVGPAGATLFCNVLETPDGVCRLARGAEP
jgi:hypothetical protein